MDYLEECLEVLRILVELFEIRERFKQKLKYRKIVDLLSYKDCTVEIRDKILLIIDHLIYADETG
jgi:hypothetical protein